MKNKSKESIKTIDSLIDPENAEELQRTKTDIETYIKKIQNLIKNENQNKKDGNTRRSRKEAELMGLTEDLYKQYQSLFAQYDYVIGKVVSHKKNKKSSVSSADSEEEFFSSEEVDGSNRRRSSEKEQKYVSDTVKQEPDRGDNRDGKDLNQNIDAAESERKLTSLMEEMKSLSNDKMDLQLQIESQANEVKQISIKNTELHNHVMELESLLKEKQDVVSKLEAKLDNSEEQSKSNIGKLMAQVNDLVLETKTLRTEKDEMEEKIKCDKKETSNEREDLMKKLKVMQEKLDSQEKLNKELETKMEGKGEEISQFLIQIENLKANLAETKSTEQTMMEEKADLLARLNDMELELEIQRNQTKKLEEQLRDTNYEIKQMTNENKSLQDRNDELKAAMTQRGEDISSFLMENNSDENGASMEIMALKAEVNEMRLDLDNLNEHKTKLEIQNERNQKEYAESLAKMENLNTKLTTQIADQAKTIKDQLLTIDRIKAEQKETMITSSKFRLSQRVAERKMEELAEKVKRKMEDNIRLLHQRIHVAEQLNNENKNSCKLIMLRYEQENKILGEKVVFYENELESLKGAATASEVTHSPVIDLKGFEFEAALNGLDAAVAKVEEHRECVVKNVSKMLYEVQFAKDWIKNMNVEMKQLKDNVDCLTTLLNQKEEQGLLLRDKVWNLEATVSKEGGEKLNLTNAVNQLEKKVAKLEKNLKEKDEDLDSLGEKKREAIRQLCLVVEFHRDRCNYLMKLVTNMRVNKKKK
ncbi:COP1-interactive protein 1 isoform X1 [Trifolium pratense]|uniref:COP1-interactive protein 1 isoform X1 n=1 Tax=Trifolium pratense TaxID=57577 RepID=UPI001E691DA7|nr:COP1-interactive protein 1 isoform X1 [Trifolium pratense]